jgi:hypothetical protein
MLYQALFWAYHENTLECMSLQKPHGNFYFRSISCLKGNVASLHIFFTCTVLPLLPQGRQSARLSLQSSALAPLPPHPLESVAKPPPPPGSKGGGDTLACARIDEGTDTLVLYSRFSIIPPRAPRLLPRLYQTQRLPVVWYIRISRFLSSDTYISLPVI